VTKKFTPEDHKSNFYDVEIKITDSNGDVVNYKIKKGRLEYTLQASEPKMEQFIYKGRLESIETEPPKAKLFNLTVDDMEGVEVVVDK